MGLKDIVNETRSGTDIKCPQCDTTDTEQKEYYYRCNDGDCDVLTFLNS